MKQAIPSEPARAQGQMQPSPTQGRQDGIGKVCSGLVLPPSKRSKEDVESLLRLHFKVGSNEFFNEAYAAVATNSGASPAVSHLSLFSNNFESERRTRYTPPFFRGPNRKWWQRLLLRQVTKMISNSRTMRRWCSYSFSAQCQTLRSTLKAGNLWCRDSNRKNIYLLPVWVLDSLQLEKRDDKVSN